MRAFIVYKHVLNLSGNGFVVGGIETYLLALTKVLKKNGIKPIIVQRANEDFEKEIDGNIYWGYSVSAKSYHEKLYAKIKQQLNEEDLLIWGTDTFSMKVPHKRTLAIQHGIDYDYFPEEDKRKKLFMDLGLGWLVKYFQRRRALNVFRRVNYKVCVDYNFWNWYRTFSVPKEDKNIYVIPNFAQVDEWETKAPSDTVKVVFARRFVRRRGVSVFLEVVKQLKDYKNVSFTFAGEGPYLSDIEKLQKEQDNIIITKYEPSEAIRFHKDYDIAVVPTIGSEGTSFSLLEAMSAGNAVVCTAVGGMTNIILNDYNGLMVKPNSVEALKNSLEKLIKDPALRATLAKNAHTTVSQSFSLEKWEERWSLVLNDIKKLS